MKKVINWQNYYSPKESERYIALFVDHCIHEGNPPAEVTAPRYFVRIIGKGNKQRPVTPKLVGNAARYLKDWMAVRGNAPGVLFCFISYHGNLRRLDQNLTPKTLHSILKDRVARTDLPPVTIFAVPSSKT